VPREHRGDGGETSLLSGQRVRKDDPRIACIGGIDELSSCLGLAIASLPPHADQAAAMLTSLRRMQRELYLLGAELARRDGPHDVDGIGAGHVAALDRQVEEIDARLPRLRAFILPGGGQAAASLHLARAVCRRIERQVVYLAASEKISPQAIAYLNRLSLVLFAMARWAAHMAGSGDELT